MVKLLLALVLAQLPGQTKHLPPSTRASIGTPPAEMYYFDQASYRELLKLDTTISSLLRMNEMVVDKADEYERLIGHQQHELRLKRDAINVLQGENKRLYEEWQTEARRRIGLEGRTSPDSFTFPGSSLRPLRSLHGGSLFSSLRADC